LPQSIELFFRRLTAHFDQVRLLNTGCSLGELVGQFAVIGDQQKTFAQVVQATDRVEALASLGKKLHDRRAALGIAHRRHVALGLIQHEITMPLRPLQKFPIYPDVIAPRIRFASQFCDHRAIHLNAAGRDQLFRVAAARDSRFGENLLQALQVNGRLGRTLVAILVNFRNLEPGTLVGSLLEGIARGGCGFSLSLHRLVGFDRSIQRLVELWSIGLRLIRNVLVVVGH